MLLLLLSLNAIAGDYQYDIVHNAWGCHFQYKVVGSSVINDRHLHLPCSDDRIETQIKSEQADSEAAFEKVNSFE